MSHHVVVGVDGSESSLLALDWAAAEALRRRAPLRVVHALAPMAHARLPRKSGAAVRTRRQQQAEELLGAAVTRVRDTLGADADAVEVSGAVRRGDPVPVLLGEAGHDLEAPPDGWEAPPGAGGPTGSGAAGSGAPGPGAAAMLVVGGRGMGGVGGMLLGSVGLQTASHAPCPVVVVRGKAQPGGNIAVGVDGSRLSLPAVRFACEEARLRGVSLQAIHCWMFPVDIWPWAIQPLASEMDEIEEGERRRLRTSLAECTKAYPEVPVAEHVLTENPVHALVNASSRADLLVVGSRGRGGFAGLVLGSVSHGVLHHSDCPVAVVRPDD